MYEQTIWLSGCEHWVNGSRIRLSLVFSINIKLEIQHQRSAFLCSDCKQIWWIIHISSLTGWLLLKRLSGQIELACCNLWHLLPQGSLLDFQNNQKPSKVVKSICLWICFWIIPTPVLHLHLKVCFQKVENEIRSSQHVGAIDSTEKAFPPQCGESRRHQTHRKSSKVVQSWQEGWGSVPLGNWSRRFWRQQPATSSSQGQGFSLGKKAMPWDVESTPASVLWEMGWLRF